MFSGLKISGFHKAAKRHNPGMLDRTAKPRMQRGSEGDSQNSQSIRDGDSVQGWRRKYWDARRKLEQDERNIRHNHS